MMFDVLPSESLSIRATWCFRHLTSPEDSVNTTAKASHPTWTFETYLFMCL